MKRCFDEIASYAKKRPKRSRDELLGEMNEWCLQQGVKLAESVKFGPGCAGHGLLAVKDIKAGDELGEIKVEKIKIITLK